MSNPIADVIHKVEERFSKVAPAYMKYESEKGFAIQLMDNSPYLKKAAMENPRSLMQAMANVASIGLSLNPAEKLAYLITRNVKVADGKWETRVHLDVSYMGFVRLATDSGSIKWVQAACVYSSDEFIDNGPGEKPTHKYNAFAKDRGDFVGVYCVAKTHDGDYLTTIMPADEVLAIRDRSEAWKRSKSGPWATDFSEMAKKSVIRRAFKTWPRTDERRMTMLAEAVEISNQNEGFEPILTSPALGQYTAEQKAYFDQLISKGDALNMWALSKTMDGQTFTNLYHSFAKGEKGKYQRVVDELLKTGNEKAMEVIAAIETAKSDNNDFDAREIIEDLPSDVMAVIREMLPVETMAFVDDVAKAAA